MPVEWPLVALAVVGTLYGLGRRAHERWHRDVCFYVGVASIVLAIVGPVDDYADRLFWVHMTQHVLLTMVAPPLLLLGRPWPRTLRPLSLRVRRVVARALHACRLLASPAIAFVLFNGVLIAWHVPALYDATLRNPWVHDLEHLLFFLTAMLTTWALAVVLGLASDPLYAHYAALAHRPGGLSALADQQLAAGIMWVPASIPLTVAVFVAAYRFLEPPTARLRPRET
jgi:cytochrome c oxidase assembly factor CtaG